MINNKVIAINNKLLAVRRATPALVGGLAVNFYKDSWRRQGFLDRSLDKWKQRKVKKGNKGKAILTQSGRLRRSIRVFRSGYNQVVIGTDVEYAEVHNEGFTGTVSQRVKDHRVRAHTRQRRGRKERVEAHRRSGHTRKVDMNIPKRQFMGRSEVLNKRIAMNVDYELRKALRF